jgi:hypothetical protein
MLHRCKLGHIFIVLPLTCMAVLVLCLYTTDFCAIGMQYYCLNSTQDCMCGSSCRVMIIGVCVVDMVVAQRTPGRMLFCCG